MSDDYPEALQIIAELQSRANKYDQAIQETAGQLNYDELAIRQAVGFELAELIASARAALDKSMEGKEMSETVAELRAFTKSRYDWLTSNREAKAIAMIDEAADALEAAQSRALVYEQALRAFYDVHRRWETGEIDDTTAIYAIDALISSALDKPGTEVEEGK